MSGTATRTRWCAVSGARAALADLQAALADAHARLEEAAAVKPVALVTFESLRPGLFMLNPRENAGAIWFTNVSDRAGVLCVQGTAVNKVSEQTMDSMPACQAVEPYMTNTRVDLMFAGLQDFCQRDGCTMRIKDAKVVGSP